MKSKSDIADEKRSKLLKQLYQELFGQPFPEEWEIMWHVQGLTSFKEKMIYLASDSMRDDYDLQTAVHELLHVLHKDRLQHGKEFDAEVRRCMKIAKALLKGRR